MLLDLLDSGGILELETLLQLTFFGEELSTNSIISGSASANLVKLCWQLGFSFNKVTSLYGLMVPLEIWYIEIVEEGLGSIFLKAGGDAEVFFAGGINFSTIVSSGRGSLTSTSFGTTSLLATLINNVAEK